MSTSVPENEPAAPPPAPPADSPPQWALDLRRTLDELPGKLRATLTDDDKSSIAEAVHGLFERSGAFEAGEPGSGSKDDPEGTPQPEPEATPTDTERPPKKGSRFANFASWFAGEE